MCVGWPKGRSGILCSCVMNILSVEAGSGASIMALLTKLCQSLWCQYLVGVLV